MRSTFAAVAVIMTLLGQTSAAAVGADPVAGVPASLVGVHGPTEDHLVGLDLVGHAPIRPAGIPYYGLGNNGAPALVGDCAFVGRWHDYRDEPGRPHRGLMIVDVDRSSETFTDVVGEVRDAAVNGATAREIRAVDVPGQELLVVLTFTDGVATRTPLNLLQVYDFPTGDCRAPRLAGVHDFGAARPHEFFLWQDPHPAHAVDGRPRLLAYAAVPLGPGNLQVVDLTDPAAPRLVAVYDSGLPPVSPEEPAATYLGSYLHSVSVSDDGTRAYLSWWDGGFFTVDTTAIALGAPAGAVVPLGAASVPYDYSPPDVGNTHSAVAVPGTPNVVVGDEVYQTCPYGWMRVVDGGSVARPPSEVGAYRLEENRPENCADGVLQVRNTDGARIDGTFSMHNQTVVGDLVLTSWYGGGMRVVDVSDPTEPREVGSFVPAPLPFVQTPSLTRPVKLTAATGTESDDWWVETWSYPVVRDGLIYVTDIRNGLYILEPSADAPFAETITATPFAEGNSNLRG